ncbi:hypothetical protein ACIQUS_18405 [Pseudomonas sp. NPDC090755]|uniref:hypothetical protein n=1 Tax=Pseudomonas sp. NPDC090755 TaxID=3364481 RepID=UPI00383BDA48
MTGIKKLGALSRKLHEKAGGELELRMLAQSFAAIAGNLNGNFPFRASEASYS